MHICTVFNAFAQMFLTASFKTNRIMALCMPEVSRMLKDMNDDVKFTSDMEDPVCEGSEDDYH